MKFNIEVVMKGLDKHELVQIKIIDLPKSVRKIFGIALDQKQAEFFETLGFEKESDFEFGVYSLFLK